MLLKHGRNPSTLWRWAMVCLLAYFAFPMLARLVPLASPDLVDGIRGALLGATLGLMMLTGVLKRRIADADHRTTR